MATRIKTENTRVIARFDPTPRYVTHVELYADGAIRVRWNSDNTVTNYDLGGSEAAEVTAADQIRLTHFIGDDATSNGGEFLIEIGNRYPNDTELPAEINTLYNDSTIYPVYIIWPTAETQTPLSATRESTANRRRRTYREWKALQYDEVVKFRDFLLIWILNCQGSTPAFQNISTKGVNWLKSAWQAVEEMVKDPSIHPRNMVRILRLARQGPSDAENFWSFAEKISDTTIANSPTGKRIWVDTTNNTRTALNATTRIGTADFDTTALSYTFDWLTKEDSSGVITFNRTTPQVNQNVRVQLSDQDGGIRNRIYQWFTVQDGTTTSISGANDVRYRPVEGDIGKQLRCSVNYTDRWGTGRSAAATITNAVIASQ